MACRHVSRSTSAPKCLENAFRECMGSERAAALSSSTAPYAKRTSPHRPNLPNFQSKQLHPAQHLTHSHLAGNCCGCSWGRAVFAGDGFDICPVSRFKRRPAAAKVAMTLRVIKCGPADGDFQRRALWRRDLGNENGSTSWPGINATRSWEAKETAQILITVPSISVWLMVK